jgi:hypothetical protein
MSRWIGIPVRVEMRLDGQPRAFTWRHTTYHVQVIAEWHLMDRWWDRERQADRTYYRVLTADHQVFELYRDAAQGDVWVLDKVQD